MSAHMICATTIDHITVTASQLAQGVAYVEACLGVSMQPGGEHPRMGTHNQLVRLGDNLFLEVIAPNPAATAPARARWFGLDRLAADSPACLSTWVVRSTHIQSTVEQASEELGPIEVMSRGNLQWQITIPESGDMPLDGVAPAVIEWPLGVHPAQQLPDQGLSLQRFVIEHPRPEKVQRCLSAIELCTPVDVRPCNVGAKARLYAEIQTPHGLRVLA